MITQSVVQRGFGRTFASLKHPNYRLWFIGQLTSLMGTWMQFAAQGYLVYVLTNSPAYLGYVSFANGLPTLLFTLYAGTVADRISRRKLMLVTQTMMMLLAFILAGLVFTGLIQAWHILVLAFFNGLANAFDSPTRLAFVTELVDREDLPNAIALNATMFNAAGVVGPAAAGLIYAWFGPGWCFTINGLSFIAVIIALLLMKLSPVVLDQARTSAWLGIREGFSYIAKSPTIIILLTGLGVVGMFGFGIIALMPAWARGVLSGDETTNGILLASRGVGALIGALAIASLGRYKFRGRLWTIGSFTLPAFIFFFAISFWLPLSMIALVGVGISFMMLVNTTNSMVQMRTPDHLRGRVMSVYSLVFMGGTPLGSLILGWMADGLTEQVTVIISSVLVMLFGAAVWLFRPLLRKEE